MHYTTDKGDIGVAEISADIMKRGVDVLRPLSASLPFDLVAYKGGRFYKIQVKYREEATTPRGQSTGFIEFAMTRAVIGGGKVAKRRVLPHEVDVFAIYCPTTDGCYYLSQAEVARITTVTLRTTPSKNNQKRGVRMAVEYTDPLRVLRT